MTLAELVDLAEHDALLALTPAIYNRVAALTARGWSPRQIARLYARAPASYPALVRRVEGTARWLRRAPTQMVATLQ